MKRILFHQPAFRLIGPAFAGFMIYILILLIFDRIVNLNENFNLYELLFCVVLSYTWFETMRLLTKATNRFFHSGNMSWSRILSHTLTLMTGSFLLISLICYSYFTLVLGLSAFSSFTAEFWAFNIVFGISVIFYNMTYLGMFFLQQQNEMAFEREKTLNQNIEYELQTFQNEVNPYLLYHSLETLIPIIHRDKDQADLFVNKLSKVYRYMLDHRKEELTSLADEIQAGHNLIELINPRHYYNVHFNSEVSHTFQQFLLIPGSIPRVIESIVQNAIVNELQSVEISCKIAEENYLMLRCECKKRIVPINHPFKEMEYLQKAYSFYTDIPVILVDRNDEFLIKIPMLSPQIMELV
ncbi:MAG: histidine kinase [Bacteroidia bacterium]